MAIRTHSTLVPALAGALLLLAPAPDPEPLRGFSPAAARMHRQWEERFRAIPSPDSLRAYMRVLTARPHHLGSAHGKANAEWMLERFRSWGLEAEIETFEVLFPTPKERLVELVAPTRFRAKLREPAVEGDRASAQTAEQLPTYNAYSSDGDVTAPLVYVNYGVPADYERLERLGISVKGAIVIARYGGSWRGIKPKVAAEHGAIGCLIYSDPRDDGYAAGETYPAGGYRPPDGVQRGSVMDMPVHPGDPLTPGVGATADARRLSMEEASSIFTKIPVLPISYADAQPLLEALEGPLAPDAWKGALPITYRIGPGPARVHLKVRSDWKMQTVRNVVARIPGSAAREEWVVRGNHHDAWVNGAQDPISGLVALLEEARAMGQIYKEGWRPRRTIVFAAWDGEEQGLLGSTEWAETHAAELRDKAVAYVNTDGTERGFLSMGGSHTLESLINDVAREVADPEKPSLSVWKREQLRRIGQAASKDDRDEARRRQDLRISALGAGSDWGAFLQHIGVTALHLQFSGEAPQSDGVYHSIYDNFRWYTTFSDTAFTFGRALAQTAGSTVMRLAGAEVVPYEYGNFAETIETYVDQLERLLTASRDEADERRRQREEGVFDALSDPRAPVAAPPPLDPTPHLNFAPIRNALSRLERSAARYDSTIVAAQRDSARLAAANLAAVNALLVRGERALLHPEGLPGRPWYRHVLYAPGLYTGYGVKTVPAVREGIEQRRWAEADAHIVIVADALARMGATLDSATAMLGAR